MAKIFAEIQEARALGWRKGDGAETAKLELVGSELVKRAAERREEKLKQTNEGNSES